MKKFNRLVSLCLAVLLICMALPLSVGALSNDFVYGGVWLGDEAFSGEAEDLTPMDIQICEIDTKKALNAQEEIVDLFNLDGADLTGWKLWGVIYASAPGEDTKCEKLADLEPDFRFDSYTDDEFNDIASAYGEWFVEPVIERIYWFEEKPTADYPYAKTNKTADSIKWYKYSPSFTTKEVVENVTDEATEVQFDGIWDGTYNAAGYWESEYSVLGDPTDPNSVYDNTIDMAVSLSVGDILKITVSDGFDGDVHQYFEEEVFTKDGNTYTYVSEYDSSFNFYIHNATAAYTADISIDFVDYDVTEISGQNKEVYTGEGNQLVACHASFEDGKYLVKTDMVELGASWITGQPSADAPTLETNKPADSYQWYDYKTVTKKYNYVKTVADSEKEIAFDDIDFNQVGSESDLIGKNVLIGGQYDQDGYWKVQDAGTIYASSTPTTYTFAGYFAFNEGDKFKIDITGSASTDPQNPDYEIQGMVSGKYDYWDIDDLERDSDGGYIIPKGARIFAIGVVTTNSDIKVKLTRTTEIEVLTAVSGQTAKTFTGESGTYLLKATYADGTVLRGDVIKYEKKVAPAPTPTPDENAGGQGTAIPDTGDTASVSMWFMTAILSLAVLAGVTVYRKRTEK